jgi:acid stress-induced BolA-like protein IbaG/YrbA
MPVTAEEVRTIIQRELPGARVDDLHTENFRVTGTIRWDGFRGKDTRQRHQLVTDKVRARLGMGAINVGVLHALTLEERL